DLYQYQPLDHSKDAIRLIRLLKGGFTDEIQCEIFETFLHDTEGVPYDALSYTWGSTERSTEIGLNGQTAQVTQNLHMALRYLRYNEQDRILWIDAVCIDQGNHRERGHQVGQMRFVYECANQVIIWLGEGNSDADYFMDTISQLHRKAAAMENSFNKWWAEGAKWNLLARQLESTDNNLHKQCSKGLWDLLGRPWFKRVWIIQEVAKARRATVVCGLKSVSTRIFAMVPSLMGLEPDSGVQAVLDVMPSHLRKQSWWSDTPDLYTLLMKFATCEATYPHDKIYALLGISSDARDSNLFPTNYEQPEHVVHDTISFLLFHEILDPSGYIFPDWTLDILLRNIQKSVDLAHQVFAWALDNSNNPILKRLLENNEFDVNKYGTREYTPLLLLAERGCHDMVIEALLARDDVDVNIQEKGDTALIIAAENGRENVVKQLLKHKYADVNHQDSDGQTAFSIVVERDNSALMKLFFDHEDIDVNINLAYGVPVLWGLASNGNLDMVELLLNRGANIEVKCSQGRTPLFIAASNGYEEVVRVLLERGANIEAEDHRGWTPLSIALKDTRRHASVVRLLLKYGAHKEHQDRHGRTPLSYAAQGGYTEIVQLLLMDELNYGLENGDSRALLSYSAEKIHTRTLELSSRKGADQESRDNDGRTPLSYAVEKGHLEVAQLLLRKGASQESRDNHGRTPLSYAARTDNDAIVGLLLEYRYNSG
ncbi:ankyrin repeat-containing domain protein, partial [Xylogone sp. PMI_703]